MNRESKRLIWHYFDTNLLEQIEALGWSSTKNYALINLERLHAG